MVSSTLKIKRIHTRFLLILVLCIMFLPTINMVSSDDSKSGLAISISLIGKETAYAPGDTVFVISEIRNSQSSGRVDVIVTYQLLQKNVVVLTESTTVAIETLSSFSRELFLPESLSSDSYILKTSVMSLDGEQYAVAMKSIDILKVTEGGQQVIQYMMGISLIGTLGALFYEHRRISKFKLKEVDLEKYVKKT